jgi:hypothetical protein
MRAERLFLNYLKIFSKKVLTTKINCGIIARAALVPPGANFALYHTSADLSSKKSKKIAQNLIPEFVQCDESKKLCTRVLTFF